MDFAILHEYGPAIWSGLCLSIRLALAALCLAIVLGLAGASAKLARQWPALRFVAASYTTLIRSVPDLLTMLLLYYSLQMGLNQLTDALHWEQIDIDPFAAGVCTIGFIYGAYLTETFRGAFLAVPKGQMEAAIAFGMSPGQAFRRVLFPQMMRYALPGVGNIWLIMIKATALASLIGMTDLVKASQDAGKATQHVFFFIAVSAVVYLALTSVSTVVLFGLERRFAAGFEARGHRA
jgi:histidine transport system permease protein